MSDELTARRLTPIDVQLLKAIRLEALAGDPDAFGSTYAKEAGRADDEWLRWMTNRAVFVVEHAREGAVGLAAAMRDPGGEPVMWIVSMWVREVYRGGGAADALMRAVLAFASGEGIATLRLHVVAGNVRATKLYTRHGFYPNGNVIERERDGALEIEMQRD